ncbi:Lipopolysaccharide kinase Kdo/WaaP [Lysobacter silvestris]|uniref:3-deoxy-D-manno-octulosonic acid kinase n=2 Tax=Solilutibacter silvestris TaxID=1645665 RepID=A0A2K1PZS4_9GAMM|nr:Lipopolysaccharide kinase Kdo/WaaP [Lysobacter silvestris]
MLGATAMPQPQAWWFDPASPQLSATPVQSGGRGSAWFVHGPFGDGVLRHYRRGGAMAKLSRDRYLWGGEARVRSVAEFRLLEALQSRGLPAPAPIAAAYWRAGAWYRAAIIVAKIADARTLASTIVAGMGDEPGWHAAGAMIARFHAAGLEHGDLNAHNILFDGNDKPWLIDFDKSHLHATLDRRKAEANLARLERSIRKVGGGQSQAYLQRVIAALRAGYRTHGDIA